MKVFIVEFQDYDEHGVHSVWIEEANAEKEAARLNAKEGRFCYFVGEYTIMDG